MARIDAFSRQPYRLKQGCDNWNYAGRKIKINGTQARIAGGENGDVVMLMACHYVKSYADYEAKQCFEEIAAIFHPNDINIIKVKGMRFNWLLF